MRKGGTGEVVERWCWFATFAAAFVPHQMFSFVRLPPATPALHTLHAMSETLLSQGS